MLELVFGALYLGTSASLVKKIRPNAFRGSDGRALATDIALTAAGAVTVAPIVVCLYALGGLAGVASGSARASRR